MVTLEKETSHPILLKEKATIQSPSKEVFPKISKYKVRDEIVINGKIGFVF